MLEALIFQSEKLPTRHTVFSYEIRFKYEKIKNFSSRFKSGFTDLTNPQKLPARKIYQQEMN